MCKVAQSYAFFVIQNIIYTVLFCHCKKLSNFAAFYRLYLSIENDNEYNFKRYA